MRGQGTPSEVGRLVTPVLRLLDGAWQRMHWWVATMVVLYAFSGITVVRPDEVAVVLRWGRLVGTTPALQEHGPGLLFAFPRPIDRVIRVPVKHVWEVPVHTLASVDSALQASFTLDPLVQGYALTGDQNVVHVDVMARYRVREAAQWAFYGPRSEDVLRAEVTGAIVRSIGEMGVDRVLADGRKALIATSSARAQAGLDASHSGLELTSLEFTSLSPPTALAYEFDAVQSAFISAETKKKDAQAVAEIIVPRARAEANASLQNARGAADSDLAIARGEASAFALLNREYQANPQVVRERLYRDAVERALGGAGTVRWVPPPSGKSYNGFRITLQPATAGPIISSSPPNSTTFPSGTLTSPPPPSAPSSPPPSDPDDDDVPGT